MSLLKEIASEAHFCIDDRCTLKEAMEQMRQNPDGSVVLVDGAQMPVGILSESDIVRALSERVGLDTPAMQLATKPVIAANENRPVEFAFHFLSEHDIRRVVLVSGAGKFRGVVLQEDLFDYLEEEVFKVDLKIADIVKKTRSVVSLGQEEPLYRALELMQAHRIGSVLIVEEERCVGIVTEKDILKLAYAQEDLNQPVSHVMSSPVISLEKETLVTDAIALMQSKKIRRVVVTDAQQKALTILTNRDILRHIKGNYSRILQIKIKHAQEIMDFLPEAIVEIFDSGKVQVIHWMNKKARELFGDTLIDRWPEEIFGREDWQRIYTIVQKAAVVEAARVAIGALDFEVSGTLSNNLNNRYIKLILKDVTAHEDTRRKLQKEVDTQIEKRLENEYLLMQQSKLATMGEMIGHIAHQWRQPLAQLGGIFMNLDAAYAFDDMTPQYFQKQMKKGNELIKYMSHTIDDFRHFFEPGRSAERFALSRSIHSSVNIIQASLTYHHIRLEIEAPSEEVYIYGYPSEFSQVILNLLDNAKDVLIQREIENPRITISTQVHEKSVKVSVCDNGGGIDEAVMERIFDIYFTTKAESGGSGLGLYMSRLIMERRKMGTVDACNSAEGACFCLTLEKM